METKPALLVVKGNEEQVAVLKLAKEMSGSATSGYVVGERRRYPVEDRHVKDEVAHLFGLSAEHLLRQVFTDETVVPAEMVHELRRIGPTGQRQRCQVESCRPAFGPVHQFRYGIGRQLHAVRGQERRHFLDVECQVLGTNF